MAIGNYLNGGTSRGQAYGVKLDVLQKVVATKSNLSQGGSILTFVISLLDRHYPDTLHLCDSWISFWAATDISLKQLEVDIKQLTVQIDYLKTELRVGLPIAEEKGKNVSFPLKKRIDTTLFKAEPRLAEISSMHKAAEASVKQLMNK